MTESLVRLQRRVDYYLFDMILLGCVADPIIYAVRMRQVRSGYARVWNKLVQGVRRLCLHRPLTGSVQGRTRNRNNEARSSSTDTTGRRSNFTLSTV